MNNFILSGLKPEDAAKQIEKIAIEIEEEIKKSDQELVDEQNELIGLNKLWLPVFDEKRKE